MYYSTHQITAPAVIDRRLYNRKSPVRLFVIRCSLVFAVMLIAFSAGAIVQANAGAAVKGAELAVPKSTAAVTGERTITVEQGDTLWDIAQACAPKGTNVRAYLDQMKRVNHLTNASLRVGQQLLLP